MKLMKTTEAVGQVLCHDMTQIIPDVTKDAVFRKGHIVREEDIPVLLSIGKDHIYVWEKDDTKYHEDEAADILRGICQNEYMRATDPKEGKIELIAESDGLFQVDEERLLKVNSLPSCTLTISRTKARPSPTPPSSRLLDLSTRKNGSNTLSLSSFGIPLPVSSTDR